MSDSTKTFLPAKFSAPNLLFGLLGFGISLYALYLHITAKSGPLSCDVNEIISCSKVIGGEYGEFLGIPLGGFGMSYFGIVIGLSIMPKQTQVSEKWLSHWQLVLGSIGFVVSAILAYISYFKINAVCLVCSAIHVTCALFFVWSLFRWLKFKKDPIVNHPNAFLKLLSTSLALAVPPLLASVILPAIAPMLTNKSEAKTSQPNPTSASATPMPADTLVVAKSNMVGAGEDYRKGNDNSKNVLIMYSDFGCPHCKRAADAIQAGMAIAGSDRALFVYRNYPLSNTCNKYMSSEGHKFSCQTAMAARCAGQQGKFWEFKDWIFSKMDANETEQTKSYSDEGMSAQAVKLGLKKAEFESCVKSKIELAKIKEDIEFGQRLGLKGTPLIVYNGKVYDGAMTPEGFATAFQK